MIRLALRQFRTEGIIAFVLLAALAVLLASTGAHLVSVSDAFKSACSSAHDCTTEVNPVVGIDGSLQQALEYIGIAAPALIGLFFGAPLIAREIETGTFRLAWTQSVTQRRWLAVKLGVVGVAAMAFGGFLTWMANWWSSPLDAVNQNRFSPTAFGYHGVAPIGYAAFAFALGVTAGVVLLRTVPAMAVTLAGFAAVRIAVTEFVRPNFASPAYEALSLSAGSGPAFPPSGNGFTASAPEVTIPNGWVSSTTVVDKLGHAPTSQFLAHACPAFFSQTPQAPPVGGKGSASTSQADQFTSCVHKLSSTLHTLVAYQPGSRFWPFQWAEMGIFLGAALALCGFTYWWLKREYS